MVNENFTAGFEFVLCCLMFRLVQIKVFDLHMPESYSLYFLRTGRIFDEGTLVELADGETLRIPDKGDGSEVVVGSEEVLRCPEFAENVPPGQCPVVVTSVSIGDVDQIVVDQTLHYQVIEVPFAAEISEILSATVTDRLHGWQADRYESSSVEAKYRLHIGHLRPGFYEVMFELPDGKSLRVTFIKFFPNQFTDRYAEIVGSERSTSGGTDIPEFPIPAIAIRPHHRGDAFSDELLNYALKLTTEWGENYGKPINERIMGLFPELSDDEIAELTKLSREAEYYIYDLAAQELDGKIREDQIVPLAREKFEWLDRDNAARLANIGMYYARR